MSSTHYFPRGVVQTDAIFPAADHSLSERGTRSLLIGYFKLIEQENLMSPEFEKLGELIEDVRIAMLTSVEADGTLHTRPLATLEYDKGGELWFFTSIDSAKTEEIEQDMHVSVAYADTAKNIYVAVAGTAAIIKDRQKAEELWTPMAKAWFPQGLDDPQLALLRVRVDRAEYWTSRGKATYLIGVAKASLTGKPAQIGENRKLTM